MPRKRATSKYYKIEKIKAKKKIGGKNLYYVKWQGFGEDHNTWEPEDHLENCQSLLDEFEQGFIESDKISEKSLAKTEMILETDSTKPGESKEVKSKDHSGSIYSSGDDDKELPVESKKEEQELSYGQENKMDKEAQPAKPVNIQPICEDLVETSTRRKGKLNKASSNHNKKMSSTSLASPLPTMTASSSKQPALLKAQRSSNQLLFDDLSNIILDPELERLEISNHLIIEDILHLMVVAVSKKGTKRALGYIDNDIVKMNAPKELCTYYEKFIKFE